MLIQIDLPKEPPTEATFLIAGWCAAPFVAPDVTVRLNGRDLEIISIERPDILPYLPKDLRAIGYAVSCDLTTLPHGDEIFIEVIAGAERKELRLPRAEGFNKRIEQSAGVDRSLEEAHAIWCRRVLACPMCRFKIPEGAEEYVIKCGQCKAEFPQNTKAINMISQALSIASNIFSTANVSSNPYEPLAVSLIEEVTKKDGWVLDAGAGSRHRRTKNVINLEIVDYPSTDILAVGESLPFCDNSFDGIVSLAVLEHVKDPMACAKELLRVLKPGGRIVASVPFLQPVHGYPNHYFNMTQEGLKSLFSTGKVIGCFVPPNGHPILTLQWFLRDYLSGLPQEVSAAFSRMTFGEAVALTLEGALTHPAAVHLNPETSAKISCLNSIIVEKPA